MTSRQDERFMRLALALGRRNLGRTWPNPSVGAVVVRDGVIVGRGVTQPGGRPHAETQALQQAGVAARGATLYVSLEPCSHHGRTPPCADAIIAAGISRVVSALEDPHDQVAGKGHARLRAAGIAVDIGLLAEEARKAHDGHILRMREGRPHVTLKLAVSADGKVALAGRKPVAITGEAARAHVHMMRAQHDAILVGIGTVLTDDPELTCRLPGMAEDSPVRVILDRGLRLPLAGKLATTARQVPVWIVTAEDAPRAAEAALATQGVEIIKAKADAGGIDPLAALRLLAQRGITRVMVEGGPKVAASFLAAKLVDEAVLLRSTMTIGSDGVDAIEGHSLDTLEQSLKSCGVEMWGADRVENFWRI